MWPLDGGYSCSSLVLPFAASYTSAKEILRENTWSKSLHKALGCTESASFLYVRFNSFMKNKPNEKIVCGLWHPFVP